MKTKHTVLSALVLLLAAHSAPAATAIHTNLVDHFSNIGNASTSLGGRTYLTGGVTSEGSFSGDTTGWYGKGVCTGPYSIRFGNASNDGWARTPAVALANNATTGTVTISFAAAGHPSSGNTSLSLVLLDSTDAEIAGTATTFTLARLASSGDSDIDAHTVDENGDPLSVTFADIPDSFKVRFQGRYSFLGSVLVTQEFDNGLEQLDTPDVTVTPDVHELWLSWTANEHASNYEIQVLDADDSNAGMVTIFNSEQSASTWTGARVENLQEATEYIVRVRVIGDDVSYANSAWFEDTFSTKPDPYRPEWTIGEPTPEPFVESAFSFGVSAVCYEEQWGEFGPEQVPVAQTVLFDGLTPAVAGTQPTFANGVFSWTPDTDDDGDYVAAFSVENDGGTHTTNIAFTVKGLTEETELFWENFPSYDNAWGGTAAVTLPTTDTRVTGWTGSGLYKGRSAIKLGKASAVDYGSATTPTIETINGAAAMVTLTLDAAAYADKTGTLGISAVDSDTSAVLFSTNVILTAMSSSTVASLADYPIGPFRFAAEGQFKITFVPIDGDGRMGIDSVRVTQTVSTLQTDLAVPTGLAVVDGTLSTNSFSVAWDPVANATGYDVQFQVIGDTEWTAAPSVLTTNATFSGLADDVEYAVQVRATGDTSLYNYSDWTNLMVRTMRSGLHPTLTVGASWANVIGDGKLYGVIPNTNTVSATLDDGVTPVAVALVAVAPAPSSAPVLADGALSWTPAAEDEGKTFDLSFEMTPAPGVLYTNVVSVKVYALPELKAPTVTVDASSVTNSDGHASGRVGLSWDSQYRATDYAVRAWSGSPNLNATATRVEENFTDFHEGMRPAGWIFRCASTSYTDDSAPVKLEATGHWFGTFDLGGVVTNVSFRAGGHSAGGNSTLRVYGVGALSDEDFGDKDNWGEPLAEIAVADFGNTDRDFSIPVPAASGVRRITWQYTKDGGNVGVGSVVIKGEGFSTARFLPGWGPDPVSQGLETSCTVAPTRAGRTNWAEVSVTDGTKTFSKVVEIDVPDANPVTLLILK